MCVNVLSKWLAIHSLYTPSVHLSSPPNLSLSLSRCSETTSEDELLLVLRVRSKFVNWNKRDASKSAASRGAVNRLEKGGEQI